MGYDFMLEKAKKTSDLKFPCDYDQLEIDDASFPWTELKNYACSNGTLERNGEQLDESGPKPINAVWEIPDMGSIYLSGGDSYVSLDMHAKWKVVLDLLIRLRKSDPDVVLADTNIGNYHDPASFQEFMKADQDDC